MKYKYCYVQFYNELKHEPIPRSSKVIKGTENAFTFDDTEEMMIHRQFSSDGMEIGRGALIKVDIINPKTGEEIINEAK